MNTPELSVELIGFLVIIVIGAILLWKPSKNKKKE